MSQAGPTKLLYQQRQFPIFQNRVYDTKEEARGCPRGDIQLVENLMTGLIYNAAYISGLITYDAHYQNEQGLSPLFQEHLQSAARIIDRTMGRHSIVEVGCGKGYFLEMLLAQGFDITGFDPAYEGTNPRVMKSYFNSGIGIKAKGIVLRHVLEHIQDPFNFLLRLKEANGGSGKIYIEVPCIDWICNHRAWFDIYYEHVNYFRNSDFLRMFSHIIESGRLFGGQYLFVVAELASLRMPEINIKENFIFPDDFLPCLADPIHGAIWGGASKGVIFALLSERTGHRVSTVIDINPAKQGKYLPSTGLLVQSPEEALPLLPKGSTIYIMNSNYAEEIKKMSNHAYRYIEVDHE